MQNGAMTLAAQMEERKSRSLSEPWANLLDTGTGLPDHGVSVIKNAALWDHLRTPLSNVYGMDSSSTSSAEIKDCWMTSAAGNDVSWSNNDVKILPSSQHSRQIAEHNRWIASSSPFCSSSTCNNTTDTNNNKMSNNAAGSRDAFCYGDGNAGKLLFRPETFPCGTFTRLLDPSNTLSPDSLELELEELSASSKVPVAPVQLSGPLKPPAIFQSSNILTFQSNMNKMDMTYTSPSPKPVVQQQKSGGSPSSSPSTSSSNNNLQKNAVDEGGECTTEQKRSNDQAVLCNSGFKKPRTEAFASAPMKVRKEKLGERITALQQLVSPFGKTDTASVLLEAMGYIKFLQDQVQVLSSPYLKGIPSNQKDGRADQAKYDLRSRGLCLVPVSCTLHVANNNGADFWTPGIGSGSKF